jgi:hypothetical protein
MSSTPTYSTKNTKDNRKVVVADYTCKGVFKIPDGLDLEDETVVKFWCVRYCELHIHYVDGREEQINAVYDPTEHTDWKYPDQQEIEDAEDCGIDYSDDEEEEEEGLFYVMAEERVKDGLQPLAFDRFHTWEEASYCFARYACGAEVIRVEAGKCNEEGDPTETIECYDNDDAEKEEEEEVKYPTIEEILSKMKELEEDETKWDDDTVYDAICEWDDKFADDPNWADEEDTDMKDSLRDQVCMHLSLGGFKKEDEVKEEKEEEEEDEDDEENTTKCECCGAINACAFPEGYELVKKAE